VRRLFGKLRRDRRGVTAIEFALIAPFFIFLIVGVLQLGGYFYAHSALRNAVSEGARYATIFPRPTTAQVVSWIEARRPPAGGTWGTPSVAYAQDSGSGNWRATITMTYTTSFDFILYKWTNVQLTYTRQAYVHAPATTASAPAATTTTGTGTTTGTTVSTGTTTTTATTTTTSTGTTATVGTTGGTVSG
jgi:Flp pilus assembly protein TadG